MTPGNHRCVFEHSPGWLFDGFSISPLELPLKRGLLLPCVPFGRVTVPLELPLKRGLLLPKTDYFYGNFGIFEDSMPDGYGNYLFS